MESELWKESLQECTVTYTLEMEGKLIVVEKCSSSDESRNRENNFSLQKRFNVSNKWYGSKRNPIGSWRFLYLSLLKRE